MGIAEYREGVVHSRTYEHRKESKQKACQYDICRKLYIELDPIWISAYPTGKHDLNNKTKKKQLKQLT